jgi:hypothetical protein
MPDQNVRLQTVAAWKDIVAERGSLSTEFDVLPWIYRTTMDMLGASERPVTSM